MTEITQKTRLELENDQVPVEELEESIQVGTRNKRIYFACLTMVFSNSILTKMLHGVATIRLFGFYQIGLSECMVDLIRFCGKGGNG